MDREGTTLGTVRTARIIEEALESEAAAGQRYRHWSPVDGITFRDKWAAVGLERGRGGERPLGPHLKPPLGRSNKQDNVSGSGLVVSAIRGIDETTPHGSQAIAASDFRLEIDRIGAARRRTSSRCCCDPATPAPAGTATSRATVR